MIKTLKSELKLRPTYGEMIGMINEQDKENRPPIDKVIDRRATLFRNNQFGSQFVTVDFLGLKKPEENKVKEELRQTQLRQTAMATGSSMGILSYGGRTPVGAYNGDGFETPDSDDYRMTLEQINRVRAELELWARRQREHNKHHHHQQEVIQAMLLVNLYPQGFPFIQWQQMKKKIYHLQKHLLK